MKLVVKCWKTKQNRLVKALFYETEKGRFLLTFDKWAIIATLCSYDAYKKLAEGDELTFYVFEECNPNELPM